jgi:hypothetical protein
MGNRIRKKKKQERTDAPGGHALTRLHQFELERALPETPEEGADKCAPDEKTEGE